MKVIFLDIDGVLNSERSVRAYRDCGRIFDPESWVSLDAVAIRLLQRTVEDTGAVCVLSSSWRVGATYEEIQSFADFLGVPIIDKTERLPTIRGEEIHKWLTEHPEVESYCIIDDSTDMLMSQYMNFVRVDAEYGLSHFDMSQIVRILNGTD